MSAVRRTGRAGRAAAAGSGSESAPHSRPEPASASVSLAPSDGLLAATAARVAGVSRRASRRALLVTGILALLALAACALTLVTGDYPMSPGDVLAALSGGGDRGAAFVIERVRLPRLALGALAGIAFGVAGGLLQPTLRNPLASPDILGISAAASAAACVATLLFGLDGPAVSIAAALGAVGAAVLILLLARDGRGTVDANRLLLVGIAIAFLATAAISYVITRADDRAVPQALVWTLGGLGRASWPLIGVLAATLAVALPLAAWVSRDVRLLTLGDELATGLGTRASRARVAAVGVAVLLAGAATAAAGPLAFVAFLSAPIARRLVGNGSIALVASAMSGVVIVLGADLVAQNLLPMSGMPAGIVTSIIGAPALLWLIATQRAKGRA